MTQKSYHAFWEQAARTPESALLAVDGSADESILQATGRWTAAQVAQALLLQPDDQVLELGCGVGRIGRELAPQCRSWHGVDIAANMLTVPNSGSVICRMWPFSICTARACRCLPPPALIKPMRWRS